MSRSFGFRVTMLAYMLGFAASTLAADSDQDGVDDSLDVCCDTPAGITVDEDGRPVSDFDDDCVGNLDDYRLLHMVLGEPGSGMPDLSSFATFQANFTGAFSAVGACCAAPLDPLDDGTELPSGGIPDIIISEIKPGEYIEVFNSTGDDVNLTFVPWWWCVPFEYQPVLVPVTVPAGGYARLDWPAALTNLTESDGEMILYKDASFHLDGSVLGVSVTEPAPDSRGGLREMERLVRFLHPTGRCDPPNSRNGRHVGCVLRRDSAAVTDDLRSVGNTCSAKRVANPRESRVLR